MIRGLGRRRVTCPTPDGAAECYQQGNVHFRTEMISIEVEGTALGVRHWQWRASAALRMEIKDRADLLRCRIAGAMSSICYDCRRFTRAVFQGARPCQMPYFDFHGRDGLLRWPTTRVAVAHRLPS